MKTRKCIGVVLARPDNAYQSEVLSGVMLSARKQDVNVAVFTTMIQGGGMTGFQSGEMNIYNLMNFERLAGIIYLPDTIQIEGSQALFDRIHNDCSCPVVMVDWHSEKYPSVFCDDSTAVEDVMNHLILEHGCKDIAFMTGFQGHEHSTNRLNGYYKAMEKHGLPVYEDRVFYGDFWYNEGANVVASLMQSDRGMPEAIACASSRMAYSVYEALRKNGYRVPEDVLVTGFNEGTSRLDFITYCDRNASATGEMAVELLCDMIRGKEVAVERHFCRTSSKTHPAVTCGCCKHEYKHDSRAVYPDEDEGFYSIYNNMNSVLINSPNFNEWIWSMKWYVTLFNPDLTELYLCMCENWDGITPDGIAEQPLTEFTDRMNLALSLQGEAVSASEDRWFDRSLMLPRLWEETESPQVFFFNPLHFNEQCFGYLATAYGERIGGYDLVYPFVLQNLNNALEAQVRLYNIRYLYACMEKNAIVDLMTGLYNRNGFNMMSPQLFGDAKQNGQRLMIMMADLNGLKYINDIYGHESGDEIICLSARTFAGCNIEGATQEKTFRIGGDEYVKVAVGNFTDDQIEACKQEIWLQLENFNQRAKKPYPVYLSVGHCVRSGEELTTFDEIMIEADMTMYRNKLELKQKTGFNPQRQ